MTEKLNVQGVQSIYLHMTEKVDVQGVQGPESGASSCDQLHPTGWTACSSET